MDIDVLLSTMNRSNLTFLDESNIKSNTIVINQITDHMIELPKSVKTQELQFISLYDKGLSKSRNMAIKRAHNDICIICDDDVTYYDDYQEKIIKEYKQNDTADLIVFQINKNNGKPYKKYSKKKRYLNRLTVMRVSSVEITFRRKKIIDNHIKFNELFGAGSKFTSGEEILFLSECIKKGLKILYVPISIGYLRDSNSTWFTGFDKKFFISKGACFYSLSHTFFWILILQFAVRKYSLYKKEVNFFKAIYYMYLGKKAVSNQKT